MPVFFYEDTGFSSSGRKPAMNFKQKGCLVRLPYLSAPIPALLPTWGKGVVSGINEVLLPLIGGRLGGGLWKGGWCLENFRYLCSL